MRALLPFFLFAGLAVAANADDAPAFSFEGYGDARFVVPSANGSYQDGDLGKLRFGRDDGTPNLHVGDIVGEGRALVMPELLVTATARVNQHYDQEIDLLEAWARYRPVSTSTWRWSIKGGAFFPPLSLENEEIGWTSFWTVTPSALNSWVGRELRVIGGEATLEWRRESGTVTLIGALYGWNENAGELIADSGWTLDDRVTGLFAKSREPDALALITHEALPLRTSLFKQFDSRPGWYVDLSWEPTDVGGLEIMRYDNNADPTKSRGGDTAWRTSFWDLGLQKQLGQVTLLAQGMTGSTLIEPSPRFRLDTNFRAAYALLGLDLDSWWFAARVDYFQTRTHAPGLAALNSEDGTAGTVSASWRPEKWLRLTGEFVIVDSRRAQRALTGLDPQQTEKQLQLVSRIYF